MTTTFWCPWCGAITEREHFDDHVPCLRCATEFRRLLGFVPRTDMVPLRDGEEPDEPVASRKRFVFVDTGSGETIGATRVARRLKRGAGARRRRAS